MFSIEDGVGCGCLTILIGIIGACFLGYILNIQNLWQYWPDDGTTLTLGNFIEVLPLKWIVSAIGVFFPPLGIITGWMW